MCGSRRLRRMTVAAPAPKGRTVRVEADVCLACGEQFFGVDAARRIDALSRR